MSATGGPYAGWTGWECSPGPAQRAMACHGGGLGGGGGIFRLMVLAAAAVARLPRGNSGCGALEMASSSPVNFGIRGSPALHLGLRVDGTGYARAVHSAAAIGGSGFLPLRAEPDVPGLCRRVGRTVDCFRTRQPGGDRIRGGCCSGGASVCVLL